MHSSPDCQKSLRPTTIDVCNSKSCLSLSEQNSTLDTEKPDLLTTQSPNLLENEEDLLNGKNFDKAVKFKK